MTAIQHSTNFFDWYTKLGGNTRAINLDVFIEKSNFVPLFFSSFKIDPERTKKMYNYKFKKNEQRKQHA